MPGDEPTPTGEAMRRILILGASGIIGQSLCLLAPQDYEVHYQSRTVLPWAGCLGATTHAITFGDDRNQWDGFFAAVNPDIIINLAGENRPDVVEHAPRQDEFANVDLPAALAFWVEQDARRWLIHVSTQGVFSGMRAPYAARPVRECDATAGPVNKYGWQKRQAEGLVAVAERAIIVRLTFVLGIRPFPHCGRANPLEAMFAQPSGRQVNDRWFSICWAQDAAMGLWELVGTLAPLDPLLDRYLAHRRILHFGSGVGYTRYELAVQAAMQVAAMDRHGATGIGAELLEPVKHDEAFPAPQYAQRPIDTTYAPGAISYTAFDEGLRQNAFIWRTTLDYWSATDRAKELALYFGMNEGQAQTELLRGFGHHHAEVAKDFRAAQHKARADASRGLSPGSGWDHMQLLQWYKMTDKYCWELTAYHLDVGFNYRGMCDGIRDYCLAHKLKRVLVLGDGVGDLTMILHDAGLEPIYHDLLASVTARFALFRLGRRYGAMTPQPAVLLTDAWRPWHPSGALGSTVQPGSVDAVLALDYFEHLPNVEAWVRWVYEVLKPGGVMLAQNAFGIGDDEHEGSIPMHLVENNQYVEGWNPLLDQIGFLAPEGGWRQKPA